jgi:hypothetical protein
MSCTKGAAAIVTSLFRQVLRPEKLVVELDDAVRALLLAWAAEFYWEDPTIRCVPQTDPPGATWTWVLEAHFRGRPQGVRVSILEGPQPHTYYLVAGSVPGLEGTARADLEADVPFELQEALNELLRRYLQTLKREASTGRQVAEVPADEQTVRLLGPALPAQTFFSGSKLHSFLDWLINKQPDGS